MLCAKFGWKWLSGSGEDFWILSMYFRYFVIICPWKRAGPFIWKNLNSLHPRMLCAKFSWTWLSGSGEGRFLNFVNVFSPFCNYLPFLSMYFSYFTIISPWKRAGPFIWTELIPLLLRMLCVKFGWNWLSGSGEEIFLILSIYFSYFLIKSPWKRAWPFIWTNLRIPITQGCFMPSLVEIGPEVL